MMSAVFLKILNMSITASYIILAVLAARLLLRKAPKKYSYLLWSAVGFRLCCPVSFQSVLSLFSLQPFDMTKTQRGKGQASTYIPADITQKITTGIPSLNTAAYNKIPSTAAENTSSNIDVLNIISMIWITVLALLLLYGIASYVKLKMQMQNAVLLEKGVYQSDKTQSPFILGIIKPKIYPLRT